MDVELDYLVSELHAPVDAEVASVQPGLAINADETHFEGDVYFDTVFHDDRADLEPDSGDGSQYQSSSHLVGAKSTQFRTRRDGGTGSTVSTHSVRIPLTAVTCARVGVVWSLV